MVMFGSRARGEAREDSDLDLLVILAGPVGGPLDRVRLVLHEARSISDELAERIAAVVYTVEEAQATRPFYLDVVEDGCVILDRQNTWGALRDRLLTRMRDLGSVRVRDDQGHRYWILAPNLPPGAPFDL